MTIREQLKPPYRVKDLMTVSSFISFCKKHSIHTDTEELEFFDKYSLLLPACRVLYGCVEMSRINASFDGKATLEWRYVEKGKENEFNPTEIDRVSYYTHGGHYRGDDNWMDYYKSHGMVINPSDIQYTTWDTYSCKEPGFTTNSTAFDNFAETFYTPYQMYQLHWLQKRLTLEVKNELLVDTSIDWNKNKEKLQPFFTNLQPLRLEIARRNELDARVMDIYTINDQLGSELHMLYIQSRLEHGWPKNDDAHKEAIEDYQAAYPVLLPKYAEKIKALLETHSLTQESLYDTMRQYLILCSFNRIELDFNARIDYLSDIKERTLRKHEDPCERASLLIWALTAIDSKYGATDLKNEMISGIGKRCRFCHKRLKNARRNQSTCGSKQCDRELSKALKQEGRKSGRYRMR